jgi:hypothetical protein
LGVGEIWAAVVTVAFWLALLLSVLALVVGIPSHRRFRRSAGVLQGQEMVIGGWIGGLCAMVLAAGYAVLNLASWVPFP